MFKPTYLYIKTHNQTGLKYFGKTTRKDPYKYKGSGKHWVKHINIYGYDVTTEIVGYYTDKDLCMRTAIEFSEKNNIVESTKWANLKIETLDGGDTSHTEGYKRYLPRMSEERKKCKWWNNGTHQMFAELPNDDTYIRGRLSFNNIGAQMGADIQREKFWINNGKDELMIHKDSVIPMGYDMGRLHDKAFGGMQGMHTKGTHWWNNGIISTMAVQSPGPTWVKGRIKSRSTLQD